MLAVAPSQTLWRTIKAPFRKSKQPNDELPARSEALGVDVACRPRLDPRDEANTRDLNDSLLVLSSVFPDVRFDVFRELLSSFSEESRLQVVTEALLKNKDKLVRGRWRTPDKEPVVGERGLVDSIRFGVPKDQLFRSESYKSAVKAALYEEFRGLSHSTIKGVLAECNHSYTLARPILIDLNKRWTIPFANFFRKRLPDIDHPLVTVRVCSDGVSVEPTLRQTYSPELAHELQMTLIEPLRRQKIERQLQQDQSLAESLNDNEAEAFGATFDCQCCFTPSAFECISVCSDHEHYLCFRCLRLTIHEAVYGQGWARSVDPVRCTLRCIAPSSGETGKECTGFVPTFSVARAVCAEKGGSELWHKFENMLVTDSLNKSGLSLAKCPFCPYAEVLPTIPAYKRIASWLPKLRLETSLLAALWILWLTSGNHLGTSGAAIANCALAFALVYCCLAPAWRMLHNPINALPENSQRHVASWAHHTKGRKFHCQSPSCGEVSCLDCSVPWHDPHSCHSASRDSLRHYVDSAVTAAVKRTCPLCGLSFIKSSGCNKLICPCGYAMCYVCRADVRVEKYAHFCPHFRPDAQPCSECDKCFLYAEEDVEAVRAEAREHAEREWWETEGRRRGLDEQRLGDTVDSNLWRLELRDSKKSRWNLLQ